MIWALLGALLIGMTLGLLGSGGSILMVPVLVYVVGEPEKLAIAESLGVVALVSLISAIPFARARQVDWRSVVLFGLPGMAGAYLGALLSKFIPGPVQLAVLAGVMLLAAAMMLNRPERRDRGERRPVRPWFVVANGLAIGALTGLVGVGGGFLIVPALVLLGGLSMRRAIGTSLVLIAVQSGTSFSQYLTLLPALGLSIHWEIMGTFAAIGIFGSLVGSRVGRRVSPALLRQGFAAFLLVMSMYMLARNVPDLLHEGRSAQPSPVARELHRAY